MRSDEEVCVPLPDYAIRSGPRSSIFFQPEKVNLPIARPARLLGSRGDASHFACVMKVVLSIAACYGNTLDACDLYVLQRMSYLVSVSSVLL